MFVQLSAMRCNENCLHLVAHTLRLIMTDGLTTEVTKAGLQQLGDWLKKLTGPAATEVGEIFGVWARSGLCHPCGIQAGHSFLHIPDYNEEQQFNDFEVIYASGVA
jgi:hypothetical protein